MSLNPEATGNADLDRPINGMICQAYLPTGIRSTTPDRLVTITFRQALVFLAQLVHRGFGTFTLENDEGGIRFRSYSSNELVETELWHVQSKRSWTGNVAAPVAKQLILTCPHLDRVFSAMQASASEFQEI